MVQFKKYFLVNPLGVQLVRAGELGAPVFFLYMGSEVLPECSGGLTFRTI